MNPQQADSYDMSNTPTKEALVEAARHFREAANRLNEVWDDYLHVLPGPWDAEIVLCEGYPFTESFDEVVLNIGNWLSEENLKDEANLASL